MNYKTEVFADGSWCGNALVFATEAEAVEHGKELLSRWMVPTDSRAVPTDAPVTYVFDFKTYRAEPLPNFENWKGDSDGTVGVD
jgi:hypothetical protein